MRALFCGYLLAERMPLGGVRRTGFLILMPGVVLLLAAWWFARALPELQARRHLEAVAAWPALVESRFQGEPRDVVRTFRECFKEGSPAAEYEALFATAEKMDELREREGIVEYLWYWDRGHPGKGDGHFRVMVQGDPPVVVCAYFSVFSY